MDMRVITVNHIEGFHNWPSAPKQVEYLAYRHRHIFYIECQFGVTDQDRQIEIFIQQQSIGNCLNEKYGQPAEFGAMSCEMIAHDILAAYEKCLLCVVREDGLGGAVVVR